MPGNSCEKRLSLIPFPLKNARVIHSLDPAILFNEGRDYFGEGLYRSSDGCASPQADVSTVLVGGLKVLAVRTTPCIVTEIDQGCSTLSMSYAGDIHQYKDKQTMHKIRPGDIHLSPRNGGIASAGYFSGFICQINHSRLAHTIGAMKMYGSRLNLGEPHLFEIGGSGRGRSVARFIWSCFSLIDEMLGESDYLAAGLALDEQIYRLLVASLFQLTGELERNEKRWKAPASGWSHPLDDLVDYIRSNAHLSLTLTDLEGQSHFSARHLQNLFKEKFQCTPMQFVRRQRLSLAMQKLKNAEPGMTITQIARECGYRFTSNFATAFHREFGIAPSVVLKASRRDN